MINYSLDCYYIIHYLHCVLVNGNQVKPRLLIASIGDTVYIHCTYKSNVTWYFEEGPLPNNAILMENHDKYPHSLRIQNVRLDNDGSLTCVGQEKSGFDDEFISKSIAFLGVHSKCFENYCTFEISS